MQREDASATRAGPLLLFFEEMLSCPNGPDTDGIVDQADLISLSIAFVQTLNRRAGKGGALEAKINPLVGCTVFDFTFPAMFRFTGVLPAASQAWPFCSQMGIADCAIHPAGRQHAYRYFSVYFHRLFCGILPGCFHIEGDPLIHLSAPANLPGTLRGSPVQIKTLIPVRFAFQCSPCSLETFISAMSHFAQRVEHFPTIGAPGNGK